MSDAYGRLQREAESARRDAAASAEDKHRMEQELAYMKVSWKPHCCHSIVPMALLLLTCCAYAL